MVAAGGHAVDRGKQLVSACKGARERERASRERTGNIDDDLLLMYVCIYACACVCRVRKTSRHVRPHTDLTHARITHLPSILAPPFSQTDLRCIGDEIAEDEDGDHNLHRITLIVPGDIQQDRREGAGAMEGETDRALESSHSDSIDRLSQLGTLNFKPQILLSH